MNLYTMILMNVNRYVLILPDVTNALVTLVFTYRKEFVKVIFIAHIFAFITLENN